MIAGGRRCLSQQRVDVLLRRQPHGAKLRLVQADAEVAHRVDFEPLRHTRLVANQPLDVGAKRMRERLRERRKKNAAVRIRPCQMDGAVQRNDCLPRAGGTCDASRPGVFVGDQLTLLGVQEDRPLVPRRIQSAFQFLDARHDAETPLGIGMRERIRHRRRW